MGTNLRLFVVGPLSHERKDVHLAISKERHPQLVVLKISNFVRLSIERHVPILQNPVGVMDVINSVIQNGVVA